MANSHGDVNVLSGQVVGSASGAVQHDGPQALLSDQNELSPLVKTALANASHLLVVNWMRSTVEAQKCLRDIDKHAVTQTDKRMLLALRNGCLEASQFLHAYQVLLAQVRKSHVGIEQTVLRFEQLGIDLGDRAGDLVGVVHAHRTLCQFLGRVDGADGSAQ